MAFADFQAKQQQNKQKTILREYFVKREGQVLCLSDDPTFVTLIRSSIKELSIQQPSLLVVIPEAPQTLKAITDSFVARKRPVLFIERVLSKVGDTSFLIRQFRDSFPELRIIVMTTTADKDRIMLLHESGADNFVLKPISSIDLVEIMAATLREPGAIRQLLDKARTFIVQNISSEAMKITRRVLEVKPDSASGYVIMGDALRISGDQSKAQMAYERACKYSESYLEPMQRLAELAKETDQKEMQLEYLKRLDTISPLNAQRKVEMGELQVAMGNTEAATQLFDTAVSRAYKDAISQVAAMSEKIAMTLQDTDPVQAEKYLRKCLELKGKDLSIDDLSTFNQLGISLRKQGRWEDALVEYAKALKIAPQVPELFYNMGMAYAEGKNFERAIQYMLKSLSINPALPRSSVMIAYNMGIVFSFGYTRDKSRQCMEIALEVDPSFAPARSALEQMKAADENAQDKK